MKATTKHTKEWNAKVEKAATKLSEKVIDGMGEATDYDKGIKAGAEIWTKFGFIEGVKWYRDNVWHDTDKELPEEHRNVLATTASPKGRGIMEGGVTMVVDRGLLEADKKGMFKKWAYLSDLFPTDIEL